MRHAMLVFMAMLIVSGMAEVRPASVFNHNMVLQQGRCVPVWGMAGAYEKVHVAYGGERKSCVADPDGHWRVDLAPMVASATPQNLTIGSIVFTNVVVGEVWLCSGQSNMSLRLWGEPQIGRNAGRETDGYFDAALVDMPSVRACTVPREWDMDERSDLPGKLTWKPFLSGSQKDLSAIAFHYAIILHTALRVPVGVVVSAWGGAAIAPWISPEGFRSVPLLAKFADAKLVNSMDGKIATDEEDVRNPAAVHDTKKQSYPLQCRILWNAMIRPLVPFAVRGVIWYQGESDREMGAGYYNYLEALWNGWSKAFEEPELPFYLVQLAPFGYSEQSDRSCEIWMAQEKFAEDHSFVGMVSTVDVGEQDNIHPCRKRTVAMRLAAMALNRDYGRKDVLCEGPKVISCCAQGDAVLFSFRNVRNWCRCGDEQSGEFEVAGTNGVFKTATVEYGNGTLTVKSKDVKTPKTVRYLWSWHSTGKLKNECGLPVPPFCINVQRGVE